MNVDSPWLKAYVRVTGTLAAFTLGIVDRYSKEHRTFLSSGFICQNCKKTLLTKYLVADVRCYDADGKLVPLVRARSKGRFFECPICQYRWRFRVGHKAVPPVQQAPALDAKIPPVISDDQRQQPRQ